MVRPRHSGWSPLKPFTYTSAWPSGSSMPSTPALECIACTNCASPLSNLYSERAKHGRAGSSAVMRPSVVFSFLLTSFPAKPATCAPKLKPIIWMEVRGYPDLCSLLKKLKSIWERGETLDTAVTYPRQKERRVSRRCTMECLVMSAFTTALEEVSVGVFHQPGTYSTRASSRRTRSAALDTLNARRPPCVILSNCVCGASRDVLRENSSWCGRASPGTRYK